MRLKIVNQTNEQECGVCALTALHNHFYNDKISKEQALDQCSLSDNGMSIFDFETLGHQLGIDCESYELTYDEFKSLKINSYFVLLLSTGGSNNHYVIARKQKKFIEIYDSCSMEVSKMKYSQLEKIFLNVVILVKKHPNKTFSKTFTKARTILMFDLKFVLLNLGLSLLTLAFSVGCASFLNFIIDLAISKSSINNLISICFIFILFYFVNDIFSYVSNLYMSKHIKNYFILFTSKILSSLQSKKLNFFNKVDRNWIFKIDECVFNISNFCVVEINKFITSIIFCFVCICIIGSIQYLLLIFVLAHFIIELIFFLFSYRKKQEVFLNIVSNENKNSQHYKALIHSIDNEIWINKRSNIIQRIKNNYSSIYKNYSDVVLFKSNSSLFKSILKSFCEICLIAAMSYLIIKTDKLTIGKLTFVISAFALFRNSSADVFNYFLSKIEFNVYWQVYKDLTTVSNNEKKEFCLKQEIKSLTFKLDDGAYKLFTLQENVINQPFVQILKDCKAIYANSSNINQFNAVVNNTILVDQQSQVDIEQLIKQIEKHPVTYSQYIQYFKLDLNKANQSFYETIIINLLSLLDEKNKNIFIDDIICFIKKQDQVVVKQLLNKIKKHNNVFILRKEEND